MSSTATSTPSAAPSFAKSARVKLSVLAAYPDAGEMTAFLNAVEAAVAARA